MKKHKQKVRIEPTSEQNKSVTEAIFEPNKLLIAALILVPLIIYAFGFKNQFVAWDDQLYVYENDFILSPAKNWGSILKMVCAANYHPITMISLGLNVLLFGKEPTSFIVVNAIFHALNTLLVYYFIQKLLNISTEKISPKLAFYIAFFTALLFGIHPMHVESVTWISERKDVLYTFFFLLSLINYGKYLKTRQSKSLILVYVFFVLSCMSKGMAVVLPVVLMLMDYWAEKNVFSKENIIAKLPALVFALFWGILTLNVQAGGDFHGLLFNPNPSNAVSNEVSFFNKIIYAGYGTMIYFIKLFLPINLHNFYSYPPVVNSNIGSQYYLGFLFMLSVVGTMVFAFLKKWKVIFFGLMFFFITIFLVLQFLSVGMAILAERYTYLPYIGLIFILVYLLFSHFASNTKTLVGVFAIISVIFGLFTIKQIGLWKNTLVMWENSLKYEKDNNSQTIIGLLGAEYGRQKQYDKIFPLSQNLKSIDSPIIYQNLGNAYYLTNDYDNALINYQKALEKMSKGDNENHATALFNVGKALSGKRLYNQAIEEFNKAMLLNPKTVREIKTERGMAYVNNQQYKEAIDEFNALINNGMVSDIIYNGRAVANYSLGNSAAAVADLKTAVNINPSNAEAQNNLQKLSAVLK